METVESMLKNFHNEIGTEKLQRLMEHFNGSKSVKEMFSHLWNFELAHKFITPTLTSSKKSHEEALNLQKEGDEYFKNAKFSEALEYYTLCIMHAPHPCVTYEDSERNTQKLDGEYSALSSGYAKRSAALFQLGCIEHCLRDMRLALSHGFTDNLGDLENRKAQCISLQNNNTKQFRGGFVTSECLSQRSAHEVSLELPRVKEPHFKFPTFGNCLRVDYTPEKGRHLIAERDIDPGEVLGVERSPCSSLDLDNLSSHCSTCLVKSLAPIPCPDCTMMVFCSEDCRIEALSSNHWLECRLLPSLAGLGMHPVLTLSIKVLQHYSCEQLKAIMQETQEDTRNSCYDTADPSENGTSDFRLLKLTDHLVSNKELRPSGDLYIKCFLSFILIKLLEQSKRFFVNSFGKPVTPTLDDLLFTGKLVFSNFMKISCNGFKLLEIKCCNEEMEKVDIGSGVFPTLCLFNHSCHPNCEPYIFGNTQVIRASRPISSGTEVTIGYIRGFYVKSKEARQKSLLDVYQFTCNCEACKENWPTYQELPRALQFKCIECQLQISDGTSMCRFCYLDYSERDHEPSKQLLIDEWLSNARRVRFAYEKSQQAATKMMSEKKTTEDDLSDICEALILMEKYVPFPCRPHWDVHDAFDLYFHLQREQIMSE
ncbi:SET and MYND domain-containing protein 4-like [Macrobrachium rosenbergii]|uniref:SET and MYND domain-containing protein 4-like n=1 Tax=Macrobrachium rosenbergii TaxID=79674 RepID=UPI0034D6EBB4